MVVDMKIILLGESNTGKTSLMKRYIHGIFQLLNNTKTTIGASYQSVDISITPSMQRLRVGIWDTAGAERFSSLTRHYYRESDLAVICFDLMDTKNFFQVNKWIEELTEVEPECLLVLCGTKCDDGDQEEDKSFSTMTNRKLKRVPQSYIEQVMTEWDIEFYLETSSKTGVNVDDLFTRSAQVWYDQKGRYNDVMNLRKKSKLVSPEQKSLLGVGRRGCYCGI
ncbi:hypothetical protein MP638_005419 [Amoeboaphelidium occidentale]|nr:hypothetical protein MP638_005419 [Amoeboaphelidium occidentale]